jgi:hypothetical protein
MARCKVKAAERARRWYLANKSKARANSRNYMRRKMADPVEKEKHRLRQAKWREEHRDEFNAIQRRSAQKKRDGKKRTRRLKAKPISGRQLERIRRQAVIDAARKAFKRISMETRFHFGFFSMAFGCGKAVDRIIQSHSTEAMRITTAVACLEHLLRYLEQLPDLPADLEMPAEKTAVAEKDRQEEPDPQLAFLGSERKPALSSLGRKIAQRQHLADHSQRILYLRREVNPRRLRPEDIRSLQQGRNPSKRRRESVSKAPLHLDRSRESSSWGKGASHRFLSFEASRGLLIRGAFALGLP